MTDTPHNKQIKKGINSLPPLREVIKQNGLRAEKSLGQNFLLDLNLTAKIAKSAGDLSNITTIEIGPGPGGLTRSILTETNTKKLFCIEYDTRAVKALQPLIDISENRLEVIHANALETDILSLADTTGTKNKISIIANLPYNIATPLLIGWLKQIKNTPKRFNNMVLMFQKEVANRITATPGNKAYGRLSIISGWICKTRTLFDISPAAFTPSPKITSTVVLFTPHTNLKTGKLPSFKTMEEITKKAFGQRRKKIRTSLKDYTQHLKTARIDENKRAEEITIKEYIHLAEIIEKEGAKEEIPTTRP